MRAELEQRLDALAIRTEVVKHPEVRRFPRESPAGGPGLCCSVSRARLLRPYVPGVMCRRKVCSRAFLGFESERDPIGISKASRLGTMMLLRENLFSSWSDSITFHVEN